MCLASHPRRLPEKRQQSHQHRRCPQREEGPRDLSLGCERPEEEGEEEEAVEVVVEEEAVEEMAAVAAAAHHLQVARHLRRALLPLVRHVGLVVEVDGGHLPVEYRAHHSGTAACG